MNAYQTWQSAFVFWSTMAQAPVVIAMRLMTPPRARPAFRGAAAPTPRAGASVAAPAVLLPPPAPEKAPAHDMSHPAPGEARAPAIAAALQDAAPAAILDNVLPFATEPTVGESTDLTAVAAGSEERADDVPPPPLAEESVAIPEGPKAELAPGQSQPGRRTGPGGRRGRSKPNP